MINKLSKETILFGSLIIGYCITEFTHRIYIKNKIKITDPFLYKVKYKSYDPWKK